MRAFSFISVISVLALAGFLASAEPVQNTSQIRISLTVAALNRDGVPNTNLKQSDFKIF